MVKPRVKKLNILGLGYSVGTPGKRPLEAPVIVVRDYAELERRAANVSGKIVVFNFRYESYGLSVDYREHGASRAAKYGGLAALIRSVTPFSINSPHTGMQGKKSRLFLGKKSLSSYLSSFFRIRRECHPGACRLHYGRGCGAPAAAH